LNKNLVIIRKDSDKSHSSYAVEGDPGYSYLIVDDLICSGETLLRILNTMKRECGERPRCRGFLGYNYINCPVLEESYRRVFKEKYGIERIA
jgi:hypoxanthine phosphoribosyltransferase